MVRSPSSSGWDLIWCPTTQDKLSVAPYTPCSISLEFLYTFKPVLPNIWQSTGKYFLLKWSRENQDILLSVSLINLFWFPLLSQQESCASPSVVFSPDSYHYGSASEKKCTVFQENFLPVLLHCSGDLFVIDGDDDDNLKPCHEGTKGRWCRLLFVAKLFWFVGVKEKVFI